MNKQTLFVTLTTAALMCGCQSSKVKISGRFVGGDAKNIYLEQVLPLTQSVVDSAALAPDGSYRMELTGVAKTPSLYNVIYDGERIPLLLAGGDRLTLGSVGSVIRNYTVEGSSESELLRQFYQAFVTGAQQLENMGTEFARKLTDEERKSLIKEYTAEYYRIRREQLRFIIEHKASLAAVYALYQRLPGDTYLFNGDSDVVYYRTVAGELPRIALPAIVAGRDRPHGRPHQPHVADHRGAPSGPRTDGHLRQEDPSLVAGRKGRAAGFLVGGTGVEQRAERRSEGTLSEICRRTRRV